MEMWRHWPLWWTAAVLPLPSALPGWPQRAPPASTRLPSSSKCCSCWGKPVLARALPFSTRHLVSALVIVMQTGISLQSMIQCWASCKAPDLSINGRPDVSTAEGGGAEVSSAHWKSIPILSRLGPRAGMETRLQLYEPLVTLQKHVAALVDRDDEAAQILLHLAAAARRTGRLPIAMIALHELQTVCRCLDTCPTCCIIPCIMK